VKRAVLALLVCCGDRSGPGKPHAHLPVDRALELALVFPNGTKSVGGHHLTMQVIEGGLDGPTWFAKTRRENPRSTVTPPEATGDGYLLTLDSGKGMHLFAWYRSLGPIGVQCLADVGAYGPPIELVKNQCFGMQLLDDGLYVPFKLDREGGALFSDKPTGINIYLKLVDKLTPRSIEEAIKPGKETIDRVTFDGGWGVVYYADYMKEFKATVRRTIGTLELWCRADGKTEAEARRGLRACLDVEPI
jgi:hypothetical protein